MEIGNQEVQRIGKDKVKTAIKRMKNEKTVGPDDIPEEEWRCSGEMAVNKIFGEDARGVKKCTFYRGIKLISNTMRARGK